LFVLRDFDDRGNNFERIKAIIDQDVLNIWNDIYKPDQYKDSKPQDFFHFEFSMLPHKIYEEDKFVSKAKELRTRFDIGAVNTLFPSLESKNVPMDGLPLFIENTWEKIRTQKELNLPDQRIMVANLRCNELRDEALEQVKPQIQELTDQASMSRIENF
jgi:protein SEY1